MQINIKFFYRKKNKFEVNKSVQNTDDNILVSN